MFGIGGFELFLILLFGFLIFGPDKLPALAKTIGQAIGKFRDAQAEMTEQLKLDELLKQDAAKAGPGAAGGTVKGAAQPAKGAVQAGSGDQADEKPLSFSERKARYEQQRAAAAKGGAAAGATEAGASAAKGPAQADRAGSVKVAGGAPASAAGRPDAPGPEEANR